MNITNKMLVQVLTLILDDKNVKDVELYTHFWNGGYKEDITLYFYRVEDWKKSSGLKIINVEFWDVSKSQDLIQDIYFKLRREVLATDLFNFMKRKNGLRLYIQEIHDDENREEDF